MDRARQKLYYNRCDPQEWLPAGDARYEPFDDAGLRGPDAPAQRLLEAIELTEGPTTQLFSGLIGSGKSTELHRFADVARRQGYFVAFADVLDRPIPFLDRANPIQTADVLFSVCLTIDDALSATEAAPSVIRQTLDRIWNALFTKIEIPELGVNAGPVDVKLKLTTEPTFRQQLSERLEASPLRYKQGVHEFVGEADKAIKENGLGQGLVVVLDGLEKVADTELDRERKEAAFREVFLLRAEMVRVPCDVVYSISPFMIQHSQELGALYDSEPVIIPMVRVRQRPSGREDPKGVDGMLSALDRRMPIAEAFESREVAKELVLKSGGFLRDLLRLAREAVAACPSDQERITKAIANRAVKRVERGYREGLFEEYRGPLTEAHNRKKFPLSDATRPLFGRLLRAHMLLRYHNDEEWYDAHPLLWEFLP